LYLSNSASKAFSFFSFSDVKSSICFWSRASSEFLSSKAVTFCLSVSSWEAKLAISSLAFPSLEEDEEPLLFFF